MELIERYIYAVVQKLPQAQRDDIAKELRSLIRDMLEEHFSNEEITDENVETVLLELGSPRQLAQKYRSTNRYLIGPEFFDAFISVLKIVLFATSVSLVVLFSIEVIIVPSSILESFIDLIVSFFTVIPTAIGWTVFGFAIAEHFSGINPKDLQFNKEWKVSELPLIPDEKRKIKRGETIFGIILTLVFLFIFTFANEYFGVWVFKDDFSHVVRFLSEEATDSSLLLLIIFMFGFGILKELLKLYFGKWTKKLVIFTTIINLFSIIVFLLLINLSTFWNPNFMLELTEAGFMTASGDAYNTISEMWNAATFWVFIILIIILVWDLVFGIFKLRKN